MSIFGNYSICSMFNIMFGLFTMVLRSYVSYSIVYRRPFTNCFFNVLDIVPIYSSIVKYDLSFLFKSTRFGKS